MEFLDRHPVAFVAVLLVAGAVIVVIGIPLPKRTQRQSADGIETTWNLDGGVPGLGSGLVAIARAVIQATETNAKDREAARTAHAKELQAHKADLERISREQERQNENMSKLTENVRSIASDLHVLVTSVREIIDDRNKDRQPIQSTDRASQASCAPSPKH